MLHCQANTKSVAMKGVRNPPAAVDPRIGIATIAVASDARNSDARKHVLVGGAACQIPGPDAPAWTSISWCHTTLASTYERCPANHCTFRVSPGDNAAIFVDSTKYADDCGFNRCAVATLYFRRAISRPSAHDYDWRYRRPAPGSNYEQQVLSEKRRIS